MLFRYLFIFKHLPKPDSILMLRTGAKLIPCIVSENSDLKLLVSRYYQLLSITEHLVKFQKHSEFKTLHL